MKKTTKKNRKQKMLDFNMKQDNEYQAEFSLGPNVVQYLEFKLDEAECGNLTYDEVEMRAYSEAEKLWSIDSFPNLELKQIRIKHHACKNDPCPAFYPVFSESMKKEMEDCKNSDCEMYLVLPDARYSLTPECELWMTLKEQGLYGNDSEFDFDKMHKMLEIANKIETK